jgi:hypothetical protein
MVNRHQSISLKRLVIKISPNGTTLQGGNMNYDEFFEKALAGRSVNQASKDWGIPQVTLNKWKHKKGLPDYDIAVLMAMDAGVTAAEAMKVLARETAIRKQRAPVLAGLMAALAGVTFFMTPSPADATDGQSKMSNSSQHYVK